MIESHWIPILYLKNFGFIPKSGKRKSRNKKIYYFSKSKILKEGIDKNSIQRLSLGKICMLDKFYSEKMEKYLNIKIETNVLDDTFTQIISENAVNTIDNKQKLSIQQFILTQLLRTPANIRKKLEMIKWLKTLPKEIYDKSIQNYENPIPQKNLPSTREEYQKMLENNIYLVSKFPDLLKNYKIQIWINETNIQYYTSDNPIIDLTNFMFWNNKILELKLQYSNPIPKLVLPINPRILLLFEKASEIENMIYPPKRSINDLKEVLKINNEIVRNAEDIVLMKSKNVNNLRYIIKINPNCLKKKQHIYRVAKLGNRKPKVSYLIENNAEEYACRYCGKKCRTKEGMKEHLEKYCKIKNLS